MDECLNLLNIYDVLAKRMDQIIDAFVSFYGEDEREYITERLKNTLIVSFASTYYLNDIIIKLREIPLRETFNISGLIEFDVTNLIKFLNGTEMSYYDKFSKADKMLLFGDSTLSAEDAFQKYKSGKLPKLDAFMAKYNKIKPISDYYQKIIDVSSVNSYEIRCKYYRQLVEEFKEYIPQEELDAYYQDHECGVVMNSLFGNSVNHDFNIFDNDSEANLHNDTYSDFKKNALLKKRLAFLRLYGYEHQSYDECLEDAECRKFIEKMRELCNQITRRKRELFRLQEIEVIENLEDYKKCMRVLNRHDFLNKNYALGPILYENFGISVCDENYTFDGSKYIFSPILFIALYTDDTTIIHEMNHAIEYHVISVNSKGSETICGWDVGKSTFKTKQEHKHLTYTGIIREYELLNEYVNERIAVDITEELHNKAGTIVRKRDGDVPSYMLMEFLLEEFYLQFKDIIVVSRLHGNIEYLYQKLGKDNFLALNELVNSFNRKYGIGYKSSKVIADYVNGQKTEAALVIADYVTKRDEIINNMKRNLKAVNHK